MYPNALSKKAQTKLDSLSEEFPIVAHKLYDWPSPKKLMTVAQSKRTKCYSTKDIMSVVLVMEEEDGHYFVVSAITGRGGWLSKETFKKYKSISHKEVMRRLAMHGKGGSNGKRN